MLRLLADPANLLALVSLWLGGAAALAAMGDRGHVAPVLLVWAGVVDLGHRRLASAFPGGPDVRRFGGHLDGVVDICSFGFAPVVVLYQLGLDGPIEVLLLLLYLGAVAIRLARFGLTGDVVDAGGRRYFEGVPATYMALLVPASIAAGELVGGHMGWAIPRTGLPILSVAMLSTMWVPRPGIASVVVFAIGTIALTAYFLMW